MEEKLNKTTKIKIEFARWLGKAALEIDAETTKEAVETAAKDGANLYGANHNNKELWKPRPVLQLGCCGSVGRTTLVMFYDDKSEPMIYCGCFKGTIDQFEAKIHKTHAGTFHEYEYMAMVDHIKSIRKYQLEVSDGE